jgi:hypothetical protein
MDAIPLGGIITLAVLLPNLLVMFFPPTAKPADDPQMGGTRLQVMTVVERIGQVGSFAIPFFYRLKFNGVVAVMPVIYFFSASVPLGSVWLALAAAENPALASGRFEAVARKTGKDCDDHEPKRDVAEEHQCAGGGVRIQEPHSEDSAEHQEAEQSHGRNEKPRPEPSENAPRLDGNMRAPPPERPVYPYRGDAHYQAHGEERDASSYQELYDLQQKIDQGAVAPLNEADRPHDDDEADDHCADSGDKEIRDDGHGKLAPGFPEPVGRADRIYQHPVRRSIALDRFEEAVFHAYQSTDDPDYHDAHSCCAHLLPYSIAIRCFNLCHFSSSCMLRTGSVL